MNFIKVCYDYKEMIVSLMIILSLFILGFGYCYKLIEIKNLNSNILLATETLDIASKEYNKNKIELDKYINKEIKSKNKIREGLNKSIDFLNNKIDPDTKNIIIDSVIKEGNKFGLPPLLIICLINQESSFNPLSHNSLDATGLMQVIPKYHTDKIQKYNWSSYEIFYIRNNILLGTEILKEYLDQKDGDIVKALQKYVGEETKGNAKNYVKNIINDYISLEMKYFL